MSEEKEKNRAGRKWFDGKDEETVVAKCKEVWAFGGTDAEAAFYAEVSKDSICRYLKAHEDVKELRNRLQEMPILQARKTVVENLTKDPNLAFKYLERKRRDEFGVTLDASAKEDPPPIALVRFIGGQPHGDPSKQQETEQYNG